MLDKKSLESIYESTGLRSDLIKIAIFPLATRSKEAYDPERVDMWVDDMAKEADRVWDTLRAAVERASTDLTAERAEIAEVMVSAHRAARTIEEDAQRAAVEKRSEASEILDRARKTAEDILDRARKTAEDINAEAQSRYKAMVQEATNLRETEKAKIQSLLKSSVDQLEAMQLTLSVLNEQVAQGLAEAAGIVLNSSPTPSRDVDGDAPDAERDVENTGPADSARQTAGGTREQGDALIRLLA